MKLNKESNMAAKVIRIIIPDEVLKKFKIICIEREVSVPKMTTQLLKDFIEHDRVVKKNLKKE